MTRMPRAERATLMSARSASPIVPLRLTAVETVLEGHKVDDAIIAQAEAAASAAVDPADDIHASGVYRKHLIGVMVERALRSATS